MDPAVAQVRRAVRLALADLAAGDLVLVGVSGGADSLALAAATAAEAPRLGLRAGAVTVDHQLQPGSEQRAESVADTCRRLDLDPVLVERVTVRGGGGVEAAARRARYAALESAAAGCAAVAILVGHTLDDQAESVLLGLARGSGTRSLAGMRSARGMIRRPLLGVPRNAVAAACRAFGLQPWQDPHNADPRYARARVRQRVLPMLERELGPGVAAALARSAELLRADADALDAWAHQAPADLDPVALGQLPEAVRSRVLRRAALTAGVPASALTAEHTRAIAELVTAWHGQGPVSLPGGYEAVRECGRLSIR